MFQFTHKETIDFYYDFHLQRGSLDWPVYVMEPLTGHEVPFKNLCVNATVVSHIARIVHAHDWSTPLVFDLVSCPFGLKDFATGLKNHLAHFPPETSLVVSFFNYYELARIPFGKLHRDGQIYVMMCPDQLSLSTAAATDDAFLARALIGPSSVLYSRPSLSFYPREESTATLTTCAVLGTEPSFPPTRPGRTSKLTRLKNESAFCARSSPPPVILAFARSTLERPSEGEATEVTP